MVEMAVIETASEYTPATLSTHPCRGPQSENADCN